MQGSDGASVDAIQRKPRLMSLTRVQSGSPSVDTPNPTAEATALRAREVLNEATYDLVKPPSEREFVDDTDLGAAARCFLALERGTEALDRKDRRKAAALYTDKSIRAMAKTQTRPYRPSHERKLMGALAAKLIEREVDALAQRSTREGAQPPDNEPWLSCVHEAWTVARALDHFFYGLDWGPEGEDDDFLGPEESVELFVKLLCLVKTRAETDGFRASRSEAMRHLTPTWIPPFRFVDTMRKASPFDQETLQRLAQTKAGCPLSLPTI